MDVTQITNPWQMVVIVMPGLLAFLTSAFAAYIALQNKKLAVSTDRSSSNNEGKIQELHVIMNSRLNEMMELTRKLARAEGLAEGAKNERDRDSPPPEAVAEIASVERAELQKEVTQKKPAEATPAGGESQP